MVSGEHILVPLASRGVELDSIFNLNATGTYIWEQIDGRRSLVQIADLVAGEFEVEPDQARADCAVFIEQLLEARAVEILESAKGDLR